MITTHVLTIWRRLLRFTCVSIFFFNDTATTEIYTLSLHDALPISWRAGTGSVLGSWVLHFAAGEVVSESGECRCQSCRDTRSLRQRGDGRRHHCFTQRTRGRVPEED